jgi:hypothetical protein
MTSWPLYVFYMVLLASPLLLFFATKPDYENRTAQGSADPPDLAVERKQQM